MSTWLAKVRSYWKFFTLRERLSAGGDAAAIAARELGTLGDLRAVPLLIRSLAYGNGALQTQAAIALGKLGDPAALPALRRLTRYGVPAVEAAREQAVLAIVAIEKAA